MKNECLLSIIVPVYNVEKYIRSCIESIFRQNLDESIFEVIIVNDGTEDRSMEVIQDIISEHSNIIIINQENLSLSVARNNGIVKAKGEYIIMPDPDDLLVDDSLSVLLEKAISSKVDLVVADFLEMTDEEIESTIEIKQLEIVFDEKSGKELFLEDLNPYECYVWRTIYRRDFLLDNNLKFYPGIRYQDIPFTHECYFTIGLANRLNFKSAKTMFVSYQETKNRMNDSERARVTVTGNPVRPVIYKADAQKGREFLGLTTQASDSNPSLPVLLVLGGSSGARQINALVQSNLEWLCAHFIVVHQTGLLNADSSTEQELSQKYNGRYKPYQFIYEQMPDVIAAADVILSRAGANSIWEAAVLGKPMVLIPLCGSGTRGDQVDNAKFFEAKDSAIVLLGEQADDENLRNSLEKMLDEKTRKNFSANILKMTGDIKPAEKIAEILYNQIRG